jgi:hypothetical protein
MHRHAEPVGSLLAPHRVDALGAGTHVRPISHWSKQAESQRQAESQILREIPAAPLPLSYTRQIDTRCFQLAEDAVLNESQIPAGESADVPCLPKAGRGW